MLPCIMPGKSYNVGADVMGFQGGPRVGKTGVGGGGGPSYRNIVIRYNILGIVPSAHIQSVLPNIFNLRKVTFADTCTKPLRGSINLAFSEDFSPTFEFGFNLSF